eukprot:6342812-Karenia_brevis.AAC.1
MAVESKPRMESSLRLSFNSTRLKVIPVLFGILFGSSVAFILKAATQIQVPHRPSPVDKAGA